MRKKGHVVSNWKRRYMVLESGKITYYEKEAPAYPFGLSEKGVFELRGMKASVSTDGVKPNGPARFYVSNGVKGEDLLVEVESAAERDAWLVAIEQHIRFADSAPPSAGMASTSDRRSGSGSSSSSSSIGGLRNSFSRGTSFTSRLLK
jgi:hypothetical protein